MADSPNLMISELFLSIQGESSFAGLPCAFVRVAGCPLRCRWCDTAYAREGGRQMPLEKILAVVAGMGVDLVELTGGEPLAQAAAPRLLSALCDAGHSVLLETSGALDTAAVDPRARVILDVKCPGSGMSGRTHWPNLARLRPHDEVKFVLADRADYDYARAVMAEHGLAGRCQVLLSTVPGLLEPRQAVEWLLADRLPVRFQLQLHKYIWPPDARGV